MHPVAFCWTPPPPPTARRLANWSFSWRPQPQSKHSEPQKPRESVQATESLETRWNQSKFWTCIIPFSVADPALGTPIQHSKLHIWNRPLISPQVTSESGPNAQTFWVIFNVLSMVSALMVAVRGSSPRFPEKWCSGMMQLDAAWSIGWSEYPSSSRNKAFSPK